MTDNMQRFYVPSTMVGYLPPGIGPVVVVPEADALAAVAAAEQRGVDAQLSVDYDVLATDWRDAVEQAREQGQREEREKWKARAKEFMKDDDRVGHDVIMFVLNERDAIKEDSDSG